MAKKSYNEFTDSLTFGEGSKSNYRLVIRGTVRSAESLRSHECGDKEKNQEKDKIVWKDGSTASYTLSVSGTVKGAKIVRSHKCSDP